MCAGRVLYRLHDGSGVLGEFCIACGVDGWLSDGKQRDKSPDRRPPRGLQGLAGLRADAPSEARSADGERAGRPRGGRRSGGAAGRPEIWLAAAEAGDLAGYGRHRKTNGGVDARMRKTGDPKVAGCLCVMGDLNPQPAD